MKIKVTFTVDVDPDYIASQATITYSNENLVELIRNDVENQVEEQLISGVPANISAIPESGDATLIDQIRVKLAERRAAYERERAERHAAYSRGRAAYDATKEEKRLEMFERLTAAGAIPSEIIPGATVMPSPAKPE